MRCERVDVWRDCDEVIDEGEWMMDGCDEVRVLDEGMDEVNVRDVSEWMYGGIVMR